MISCADLRRHSAAPTTDATHLATLRTGVRKSSAPASVPSCPITVTVGVAAARTDGRRFVRIRHNPYDYKPIMSILASKTATETSAEKVAAAADPAIVMAATHTAPGMCSAGFALPVPASHRRGSAPHKAAAMEVSVADDGVSEVSSENGASHTHLIHSKKASCSGITSPFSHGLTPEMGSGIVPTFARGVSPLPRRPAVVRYASVNFRFGSAWFIAPFKTSVGDFVVVEYPANNSLHMGLVSAITTAKPATFYSAGNADPDTLTEDEIAVLPRLMRHARDFDKETKLDLRSHDLRSMQSAQQLASEMGAPIQFIDAEWLLDLSAITFLVNVYGDQVELVDKLADELATVEGAEVVFTYPAVSQYR